MFVLKTDHSYLWPVDVRVPQDGGTHKVQRFDAQFRILPQDETEDLLKQSVEDDRFDTDLMHRILVGWDGVKDEDGAPVPFNDETRAALVNIPYVRLAIGKAYFESIRGDAARRKN